jgi:hypothetical protein
VKKAAEENHRLARMAGFAEWMTMEVRRTFASVVRIHVSGDFFDARYTRAWLHVIRACPDVVFYAYTRSWTQPEILPSLKLLAKEHNMRLWFSCDREMRAPPRVPRVRRAWLAVNDDDVATYMVDLVFRDRPYTIQRQDKAGFAVCPHEIGMPTKPTCSQCKRCFKEPYVKISKPPASADANQQAFAVATR